MSAADLLLHPLCVVEAAGEKCLWCKLIKARFQTRELMESLMEVTDAYEGLVRSDYECSDGHIAMKTPEIERARALLARLGNLVTPGERA